MTARLVLCSLGIAIATTSGFACVRSKPGRDDEKTSTARSIDEMHARFNGGRFDEIYDHTSAEYRQSRAREDVLETMKLDQQRFGSFREATQTEIDVTESKPVQVKAVYHSNFEKGPATELFSFVIDKEGNPRLAEYRIYPGTLVLKAR